LLVLNFFDQQYFENRVSVLENITASAVIKHSCNHKRYYHDVPAMLSRGSLTLYEGPG